MSKSLLYALGLATVAGMVALYIRFPDARWATGTALGSMISYSIAAWMVHRFKIGKDIEFGEARFDTRNPDEREQDPLP